MARGLCGTGAGRKRALLNRAAETIQGWQRKGYETIAVICRDEEEAERVAARLAEDVPVKNGAKGETEGVRGRRHGASGILHERAGV